MLKSPRASALAENFAGQWLQFRSLESVRPDKERFPSFDNYLRMSMREETETFFNSIVRDDQSVLDLLLGKYTFLNERLAGFHGVPGVTGPAFRRVNLAGTPPRRHSDAGKRSDGDVVSQPDLARAARQVDPGERVQRPAAAAAAGVPNLDVSAVGSAISLRQQLEEHRKNPTCAACHARMDPLGFGLENFDAIGAWRKYDGTIAIDSSGSLPDGRKFEGPNGLRSILQSDREAFVQCLATKLLTYALGRGLERYDRATVKQIARQTAASDYKFSNMVMDIVTSRPFQCDKEAESNEFSNPQSPVPAYFSSRRRRRHRPARARRDDTRARRGWPDS